MYCSLMACIQSAFFKEAFLGYLFYFAFIFPKQVDGGDPKCHQLCLTHSCFKS